MSRVSSHVQACILRATGATPRGLQLHASFERSSSGGGGGGGPRGDEIKVSLREELGSATLQRRGKRGGEAVEDLGNFKVAGLGIDRNASSWHPTNFFSLSLSLSFSLAK